MWPSIRGLTTLKHTTVPVPRSVIRNLIILFEHKAILLEKYINYYRTYHFGCGAFVAMAGKASTWKASGRYCYQSTGPETLYTHHDHDPYQYYNFTDHVDYAKIKCIGSGFDSDIYPEGNTWKKTIYPKKK
jgi:hypothetical protein